jgi:Ca2+-dependent lipid-binding protein
MSVKLKGYLYVIVSEAKDLPNTGDGEAAIDSYGAVFLDGMEEGSTMPAFDTTEPVWNKKIKVKVVGEYTTIGIQLFDADKDDNNHLGEAVVAVQDVIDGQPHDLWLPLKKVTFTRIHLTQIIFHCYLFLKIASRINIIG